MNVATLADPLHNPSSPISIWSRTNVGEAIPGVPTPLCWTLWSPASELAVRGAFRRIGALERNQVLVPDRPEERLISIFYGQAAIRGEFMCSMGDRIPGTSGAAVAEQIFGDFDGEWDGRPSRRHYPGVAVRIPVSFVRAVPRLHQARARAGAAWQRDVPAMENASTEAARAGVARGAELFNDAMAWHVFALFAGVQAVFNLVTRLTEPTPELRATLLAGYGGHEEIETLQDLWRCSRDDISLETFLSRHGYHGPREGELSKRTWREDPTPVIDLMMRYRELDDSKHPERAAQRRTAERLAAEAALLRALPMHKRAGARLVLRLAHRHLPLRGVGKVAFLQALDVTRAAARRLGLCLEREGVLERADDVFYLTLDELVAGAWSGRRADIEYRRGRRVHYESVRLPVAWRGMPTPLPAVAKSTWAGRTIAGLGVSGGVVEGQVRIIADPTDSDIEPGEILVAHTTDPSWVTLMFLASALVVDIGGQLSHTAVVARELGIPCVANVKSATEVLRDGDYCRVDGTHGVVEILSRVAEGVS
jgi:pyruvate,water dikinase